MTEYQEFLTDLRKQIPVICANTYIDQSGTYHSWQDQEEDQENKDALNEYNVLEYNHLVDVKNRVDEIFSQPADTGVLDSLQAEAQRMEQAAG